MAEEVFIQKCPNPNCEYATSDTINYCPYCGAVMHARGHYSLEYLGTVVGYLAPKSNCSAALSCSSVNVYDDTRCNSGEVHRGCIEGVVERVENLQAEIQILRRALVEAGLQVSQKKLTLQLYKKDFQGRGNTHDR